MLRDRLGALWQKGTAMSTMTYTVQRFAPIEGGFFNLVFEDEYEPGVTHGMAMWPLDECPTLSPSINHSAPCGVMTSFAIEGNHPREISYVDPEGLHAHGSDPKAWVAFLAQFVGEDFAAKLVEGTGINVGDQIQITEEMARAWARAA